MKTLTILVLLTFTLTAQAGEPVLTPIEYLCWGKPNTSVVDGKCVPKGKVWLIRHAGIAYAAVDPKKPGDWTPVEWMMQIKHYLPTGGHHLIPVHRPLIATVGTPVLATEGSFVMTAGECLQARANWIREDKKMALIYVGWELDECYLPQLLGLRGLESSNSTLDSYNTEIKGLEKSLQTLKGN